MDTTFKKSLFWGMFFLLAFLALVASVYHFYQPPIPTQYIIDSDLSEDDWTAILYLLKNPKICVAGIIVEGNGITHIKNGVLITQKLVKLAKHAEIPIILGAERPLLGHIPFSDELRDTSAQKAMELLQEIEIKKKPQLYISFKEFLKTQKGKFIVVNLGPLTTVAQIISQDPKVVKKIERLIILGGSFASTSIESASLLNFELDPMAASMIFHSSIPIILINSNITENARLRVHFFKQLLEMPSTDITEFLLKFYQSKNPYLKDKQSKLQAELAAFIAANFGFYHISSARLDVDIDSPEKGKLYVNPRLKTISVVDEIPMPYIQDDFLKILGHKNS